MAHIHHDSNACRRERSHRRIYRLERGDDERFEIWTLSAGAQSHAREQSLRRCSLYGVHPEIDPRPGKPVDQYPSERGLTAARRAIEDDDLAARHARMLAAKAPMEAQRARRAP